MTDHGLHLTRIVDRKIDDRKMWQQNDDPPRNDLFNPHFSVIHFSVTHPSV